MDNRMEYWWVSYEARVQPAEVGFTGGIPVSFRFIGMTESIPAASAELIERLPVPPAPIIRSHSEPAPQPQPHKSGSWLWFIGILLLILVAQCSGQLFDMIK